MKTYNEIGFSRISEILTATANGFSNICSPLVVSDMIHSLSDFHREIMRGLHEPYYIAIREQGTESGNKEHCLDRCKGLGYPLIIAKIEVDKVIDFNMTIMFTHGWMNGNNNYMEQEFNSL